MLRNEYEVSERFDRSSCSGCFCVVYETYLVAPSAKSIKSVVPTYYRINDSDVSEPQRRSKHSITQTSSPRRALLQSDSWQQDDESRTAACGYASGADACPSCRRRPSFRRQGKLETFGGIRE